jgi:hypothetical protein
LSYRAYWAEVIVGMLLETKEEISIEEIANKTCITPADVMHTSVQEGRFHGDYGHLLDCVLRS